MASIRGVAKITDGTNDKLKVNGNNTELHAVSSTVFILNGSEVANLAIATNSNLRFPLDRDAAIVIQTVDGTDNRSLFLSPASAIGPTRGATVQLSGNEHASTPGKLYLSSGNITNSVIEFAPGGTLRASWALSGLLTINTIGMDNAGTAVINIQGVENNTRLSFEGLIPVIQSGCFAGTLASKTATQDNTVLLYVQAGGYDGSSQLYNKGRLKISSDGTWTAAASHGTKFDIELTRPSSITSRNVLSLSGAGKLTLKSQDNYAGTAANWQTFTVNTTDATVTTLAAITLADNTTYSFRVKVVGRFNSTTAKSIWVDIDFGAYRNNSGSATLIGTRVITQDDVGSPGYVVDIDVSSNDVRVRVTGAASETVSWAAEVEWVSVSTSA